MPKANTMRKVSQKASRFTAQVKYSLPKKQWKEFCALLDAPPKTIPALRRLLTRPALFKRR